MRFQLIPVRYAGPIVCLVIVVAMFKRHADGFLEIDRFLHMEAVKAPFSEVLLRIAGKRRAIVGRFIFPGREAPGRVEIVFQPSAVDRGRPAFAVNKNHIVALHKPRVLLVGHIKVVHIQHNADIDPFPGSLKRHVVFFPRQVDACQISRGIARRYRLRYGLAGILPVPCRVETPHIRGDRLVV